MRKIAVIRLLAFWGVISIFVSGSVSGVSENQASACEKTATIYTVQLNDKLHELGIRFGYIGFWEAIYIANADLIDNPDVIYPGQQLEIPQPISSYKESGLTVKTVLDNPFCDKGSLPVSSVNPSHLDYYTIDDLTGKEEAGSDLADQNILNKMPDKSTDTNQLSEFRDAFNALVNADGNGSKPDGEKDSLDSDQRREAVQQESERQIMMEIDGMVLDETRSKVGRDFYDVFYSNWQSPDNASNFSIRIAEQPSPSLGTIIYVEVNDTEAFRMRIQPRFDFIKQAGQYAVRQTYSYLQNNDHQLQIY